MTASELKQKVNEAGHDSHFFDRDTMRFFGDSMANYRVRRNTVTKNGRPVEVWELWRRRPVKGGRQALADVVALGRLLEPDTSVIDNGSGPLAYIVLH